MQNNIHVCPKGYYFPKQGFISFTMFVLGDDANICPEGYYCPEGTANPVPCPKGTFGNITGLEAESDCVPCTPGYYCPDLYMTYTNLLCHEG